MTSDGYIIGLIPSPRAMMPCFLCVGFLLAYVAPVSADAVIVRDQEEPIIGRILSQSEELIRIETRHPSGNRQTIEIVASDAVLILLAEDPETLEKLEPGRWDTYRDVADDLAARHRDPDAIVAAMRLLLIVAYHSEGELRDGALISLRGLARSPDEARRIEALAVRYGNHIAPTTQGSPKKPLPQTLNDTERAEILSVVRAIRQGKQEEAQGQIAKPGFADTFAKLGSPLPWTRLESYARRKPTTAASIAELAALEATLLGTIPANPAQVVSDDLEVWEQITKNSLPAWHEVDWFDVLPFDPRDCLFRDGKWRRP